jgi:peptidoglycan/LPS O-acetylase OafA/YrhL
MSVSRTHGAFAYRPALDGLRALAVSAVLLFHGGVSVLPGGFLGVDAFFVLSGFLITSLLLAEQAATGGIRLGAFWIRRARRLLPALLVVLVAVVLTYRSVLAGPELALLRGDALAALAYVANWRMIYRGDDYFARSSVPSPLQHTWSLGIEEQFYLLWPLILVVTLWLARRWLTGSRSRPLLLAISLAGVAASAVAEAWFYRTVDVDRAYFGTDTRAQALLLGCALAAVLSRPGVPGASANTGAGPNRVAGATATWPSRVVGVLSLVGLVGTGWLWTHAGGTDAWLYFGGFTAGGLAVAAVIAHTAMSPTGVTARALALPPLVWLGRISYGVYLWHWPVYGLLNADRTSLSGEALLAARVGATLAVAFASYVLIEQPVRAGRWPFPALAARMRAGPRPLRQRLTRRWPAWPKPLGPRSRALGAVSVVALTGALIVVATVPPASRPVGPSAAIVAPAQPGHHRAPPVHRSGRTPGSLPRVTFFGDSVSWSLGTYLPPDPTLAVTVRSVQGCGIARLPDIVQLGEGHTNYDACPTWDVRWRRGIEVEDPDVAVILLDRWELMDRRLNGVYQHVGQPAYDAYLRSELDLAVSIVGARGAQVVLLTAPYTRRAERPDGGLYDEDRPERVDAWNRLLRARAERSPDTVTVLDLNARVCPDGKFTANIDELRIRSDGLHFTPDGVRQWIAPWLLPQLAVLATGSASPSPRGNPTATPRPVAS